MDRPSLHPTHSAPNTSSTYMLMLGLFLILLAFFILLNAISQLAQERVKQASDGVAKGFGFRHSVTAVSSSDTLLDDLHGVVLEHIRQSFEAHLPLKEFALTQGVRGVTVVTLRPQAFYKLGSWRLLPARASFFNALAKVLAKEREGATLHLNIRTSHTLDEDAPKGVEPLVLAGYRATGFARALVERGAPVLHMTTGVAETPRTHITLSFRLLENDQEAEEER